jgi:hypothetical protein
LNDRENPRFWRKQPPHSKSRDAIPMWPRVRGHVVFALFMELFHIYIVSGILLWNRSEHYDTSAIFNFKNVGIIFFNPIIRLGQVRWSFANVRKAIGNFRRARDCSDYQLDRIEGAAIADPETGSSPGNLLHLTCCNAFWELRNL